MAKYLNKNQTLVQRIDAWESENSVVLSSVAVKAKELGLFEVKNGTVILKGPLSKRKNTFNKKVTMPKTISKISTNRKTNLKAK